MFEQINCRTGRGTEKKCFAFSAFSAFHSHGTLGTLEPSFLDGKGLEGLARSAPSASGLSGIHVAVAFSVLNLPNMESEFDDRRTSG